MRFWLALFIVFIAFSSIIYASHAPSHVCTNTDGPVADEWSIIAFGAAITALIWAMFAYMIGRSFNIEPVARAAKIEMLYVFSTILMIILFIGLIDIISPGLFDLSVQLLKSTYSTSPEFVQALSANGFDINDPNFQIFIPQTGCLNRHVIDVAKMYLAPARACAESALDSLSIISVPVEALASIYVEIFMSEHASGYGFKILAERITNLVNSLGFYLFAYYLFVHIFNFIRVYGLFFLSVGIVLRSFPLTRGAGAYIIALSIGLYFILPFSYILSASIASTYTFERSFLGVDLGASNNLVCGVPQLPDESLACQATNPFTMINMKNYVEEHQDEMWSITDLISGSIMPSIIVRVCLLPLVALTITFTFVLSSTNLFGGYIPEVGRGLIRLV